MTFADAVAVLEIGQATKRPTWRGYLAKTAGGGAQTEAYDLVWHKADGTTYTYAVSTAGVVTTSSAVSLDGDLMGSMMSTDWINGSAADFEACRQGGGTW